MAFLILSVVSAAALVAGVVWTIRRPLTRVRVNLPFKIGESEWVVDKHQRQAAWALYVELVTRVAVQELKPEQGTIRNALTSLHTLFETTRQVLKEAGPSAGLAGDSVGGLALLVLNTGLRGFLTKWHPELEAWEACGAEGVNKAAHERQWEKYSEVRDALANLQTDMRTYAEVLSRV